MSAEIERTERSAVESRRALLLDPALQSLLAPVCEKHQWTLRVIGERWDTLLPEKFPPKVLLLGFAPHDENSLEFLDDLGLAYPDAAVAAITGDLLVDVAVVVSPVGKNALRLKPTGSTQRMFPARAEQVVDSRRQRTEEGNRRCVNAPCSFSIAWAGISPSIPAEACAGSRWSQ